jgi:hypothetical protein
LVPIASSNSSRVRELIGMKIAADRREERIGPVRGLEGCEFG